MDVTKECLYKGIEKAVVGNRLGDIGAAIQEYAESKGYGVVRDLVGHGVGLPTMHEEPMVPHYGRAGRGLRFTWRDGLDNWANDQYRYLGDWYRYGNWLGP